MGGTTSHNRRYLIGGAGLVAVALSAYGLARLLEAPLGPIAATIAPQRYVQSLTDGELFWIIENGIRFTGMPGWGTGTPEGEQASWHLAMVRHEHTRTAPCSCHAAAQESAQVNDRKQRASYVCDAANPTFRTRHSCQH